MAKNVPDILVADNLLTCLKRENIVVPLEMIQAQSLLAESRRSTLRLTKIMGQLEELRRISIRDIKMETEAEKLFIAIKNTHSKVK